MCMVIRIAWHHATTLCGTEISVCAAHGLLNFTIPANGDIKIDNYGKPTFDIRFFEGIAQNQSVIPTLLQLVGVVDNIITMFETECNHLRI